MSPAGSHGHDHSGAVARGLSLKLLVSTVATLLFVALEFAVGIWANALALIGDGFHNLTDAVALVLALFVVWVERRPATPSKSFGYQRAGILAAFVNAGVLVAFTLYLFVEAWHRLRHPEPVQSGSMIVVAAVGILLNVGISVWLRQESRDDLNIRAAVIHLFGDTLSSAGVILAAVLIMTTGRTIWDPALSAVIGILILWSAWGILKETVNLLLEGTPRGIDPETVARDLAAEDGVNGVHHLHIWALAPTRPALSCHLMLDDMPLRTTTRILNRVNGMLAERYSIVHTTIQIEHAETCPDDDPTCVTEGPPC